ncbi:MAG: CBS domain-containing protein [Alphaproteobacteria bacterium]|nr:CBS domain-containing protein [Alphaproteobacteria bacterium]
MSVANILKFKGTNVVTVQPSQSIRDAVDVLAKHRIGAVVVTNEAGAVKGVLSERDVVRHLAQESNAGFDQPVSRAMTERVVTCGLHDSIEEIMEMMTRGRFRHVPVVEDDRLVGIVSIGDVVRRKIEAAELEVVAMREYIATG